MCLFFCDGYGDMSLWDIVIVVGVLKLILLYYYFFKELLFSVVFVERDSVINDN